MKIIGSTTLVVVAIATTLVSTFTLTTPVLNRVATTLLFSSTPGVTKNFNVAP